ncbi:hypothetical protein [Sphingomonas cavernae]|uniref:Uncharacterized protein n=1 Tax=Sphingomonas cavernae TaxID=2320861 RepID=A0A418WPW0_9SPHN|nr:hypothetical protein [Sphingomonas cavernae]RJF93275.1 hypothetical protein D3876_02670 [Sphingomonas cavernae]
MNWLLLAGSLAGVLGLALVARLLGLGEEARIVNAEHALAVADEVDSGFDPVAVAVDRAGYAALLRDRVGQLLLIRAHGGHFVGRRLMPPVEARLDRNQLTLTPDDPMFGSVTLNLGAHAAEWASRMRNMGDVGTMTDA